MRPLNCKQRHFGRAVVIRRPVARVPVILGKSAQGAMDLRRNQVLEPTEHGTWVARIRCTQKVVRLQPGVHLVTVLTRACFYRLLLRRELRLPQFDVYTHDDKIDAPSGTARELAARLSRVRLPEPTIPVEQKIGEREARGATISGAQVHSVRLPGYVISAEVIFGMPDQTLSIRHDSGSSARPYVDGALIAIRRVLVLVGVHRGLDTVLDV
jgi:hypothetical protein